MFTVKEVAAALGMTPRGVVQRLNRNQLKGTRKTNQFGTPEWQVYATREITQAIEALRANPAAAPQQSFAPDSEDNFEDSIDAEGVEVDDSYEQADWIDVERKRLEMLAETLVRPLTQQLTKQAAALREKELQLEDKDRQLRLLPDLQKRAEDEQRAANVDRKAAEERALEVIALKKQVTALEVIKDEATTKVASLEMENREVAAVQTKMQQLEEAMLEMRKSDAAKHEAAEAELERLKAEKNTLTEKIEMEAAGKKELEIKLEIAMRPWYKKLFASGTRT